MEKNGDTRDELIERKCSGQNPSSLTSTLIRFAYQISRGMEFLHSRAILHRDLAARNVLLFDTNVVKISHFGMAQRGPMYTCHLQGPLPVRWMPPEAIENRLFTQPSDVWSFGVVLWEMFTMGATPYAATHCIQKQSVGDFLAGLKNGLRLDKPMTCPEFIYHLMQQCWQLSPEDRPNFAVLSEQFKIILDSETEDTYLRLNNSYAQFNDIHRDILKNAFEVHVNR
ncbi:tyrosine-protein kinase receptor Tie-1-like [Paramacrobiotus metropolitanus]|uniref:tyrosine-protein kinase receptor Tie-1-like n=1 Tax=Paramacrobiotus metropolitanus TaxID=2943436 RepID=UPI00244624D5|nr:tyrosine-protein kinase receptor Tie-1-like [Paramacrobiotus metropolitanus]